jgi:diacylglycerol kinase (ATP)
VIEPEPHSALAPADGATLLAAERTARPAPEPEPLELETDTPRRVHVLVNPAAGKDKPILAILNRVFREADLEWSVEVLHCSGEAAAATRRLLELRQPGDLLAVSGGDGTVSEVAGALRGTTMPLVVLPGGTGNVVAQELGLPLDYEAAARALFLGPTKRRMLDLVECSGLVGDGAGHASILRVGLGGDARLMEAADRDAKDSFGWGAYLAAAAQQLARDDRARYLIRLDERELEVEALALVVLNIGRLGRGGARLSSAIDPADGHFDVIALQSGSLGAAVAVTRQLLDSDAPLPDLCAENLDRDLPLLHGKGTRLTVLGRTAVDIQIDGDAQPALEPQRELRFELLPSVLRALAPRPQD